MSSFDQYAQATWQFAPQWSLTIGVRQSRASFTSTDSYIVGTNPVDSYRATYSATLPVAGLMFAVNDNLHVYATAGCNFETPTLNELGYRRSG